ncbi:MAG: STAS/SEC14 domain-containing protein [Saprospiraceae bacterium]|nr:STAS/SEC14 domain-containing protein [Lewinella sp.]
MIKIEEKGNNIYMVASGKLNDEDYDKMLPLLRQKINAYEKINWYFQMKDFEGWTPHAFWRDLKFDLQNKGHLEKVAIVGEKKWQELMTATMNLFTNVKIWYFDEEDALIAKEWVES